MAFPNSSNFNSYSGYGMPSVDFTPLSAIGDTIQAGQKRNAIGEAIAQSTGPDGTLNVDAAATTLGKLGLLDEARPLLALAQQKAALAQSEAHFGTTSAETARHNRAVESQGAERLNQPQFIDNADPLTGERQQGYFDPRTRKLERFPPQQYSPAPQLSPAPAPEPTSFQQQIPNAAQPTAGVEEPTFAERFAQISADPRVPEPPAAPQVAQAVQRNDTIYNSISPATRALVDDVYNGKRSLTDYPANKRLMVEQQVRTVYPGWSPPTTGALAPEQAQIDGIRLSNGDLSVLQGRGTGVQRDAQINAIRTAGTAHVMQKYNFGQEEAANYMTQKLLEFKEQQASATAGGRTQGQRETQLKLILNVADAAVPAALERADQVWRSGFIPLNKMISASGQIIADNPAERNFAIANLQLAEGWARAMNPTGIMRESDRDMALKYLTTSASPDGYRQAVKQVQEQIHRERDAVLQGASTRSEAIKQMEGKSGPTNSTPNRAGDVVDWRTYFGGNK